MVQDEETITRYRRRAVELRSIAAQIADREGREIILKAAEAYERMADWKPQDAVSKT
jgi:hypothetical protein